MACDVHKVKLGDLMVPSGLKLHKFFLSCPNDLAASFGSSWLWVFHTSFIAIAAPGTISGPGALQVAEKWFIPGVPCMSRVTQYSDACDLVFRIFVPGVFEISLSWLACPQKGASFKESDFPNLFLGSLWAGTHICGAVYVPEHIYGRSMLSRPQVPVELLWSKTLKPVILGWWRPEGSFPLLKNSLIV